MSTAPLIHRLARPLWGGAHGRQRSPPIPAPSPSAPARDPKELPLYNLFLGGGADSVDG